MATILIVDDDPSARDLVATVLGYAGHQLREAADGIEALDSICADPPALVIADLLMPSMDGFEFVRRLREQPAHALIPVIFYTATYLESEARNLARACGVTQIITKPAEPQDILNAVSLTLGTKPDLPQPLAADEFRQKHLGLLLAKLSQKAETVVPRLDAMIELSLQLASQRDPKKLLANFCVAARKIIGAKFAVLGLLDKEHDRVNYPFASGMEREVAEGLGSSPLPTAEDPLRSERQARRLLLSAGQTRVLGIPPGHPPAQSFLCAPILSPDHTYGWLCLSGKLGQPEFNDVDEGLAQILAAQVGRIYENSSLYAEVSSSLKRLEAEMAERKRAEQQLRLQAAALETAANAIVITDRSGNILWCNPAFSTLTGYSSEEVLGQNPRLLKSGQHNQDFYKRLWATILLGKTWRGEFMNRRKDGTLYHDEHTITPVRDANGQITHFVAIMLDITERKRAILEIHRLNAELDQRVRDRTAQLENANRELEAFSYSVSHDLRAPLRHIGGYANLLSKDPHNTLTEDGRHCADTIVASAKLMTKLIDDLLEFSRMSRAELSTGAVDLHELCKQVIQQLQPESSGRDIAWNLHPLPQVHADAALLRQVILNLLSNALKYTRTRPRAQIEIGSLDQPQEEIVIFVRDNGVGFDMKYSDKLFGVFQRLHSDAEFEGTGIGLANVRRIIARHGGRTWAESKVNHGATFFFSLPRPAQPPTSDAASR